MHAVQQTQPTVGGPPTDAEGPKLAIEKFADAEIACLKFTGTIDESFEGKKLGGTTDRKSVV